MNKADFTTEGHLHPCREGGQHTGSVRETHGPGKTDKQERKVHMKPEALLKCSC